MTRDAANLDIVFYDGVCAPCNRSVRFLVAIDRDQVLSFAPLQGPSADALRKRHQLPEDLDSLYFVEHYGSERECVWFYSTAISRILGRVGGIWRVIALFRVIPRPIRDLVYRWIARHRYRWFGKFDSCPVPPPETANRFFD